MVPASLPQYWSIPCLHSPLGRGSVCWQENPRLQTTSSGQKTAHGYLHTLRTQHTALLESKSTLFCSEAQRSVLLLVQKMLIFQFTPVSCRSVWCFATWKKKKNSGERKTVDIFTDACYSLKCTHSLDENIFNLKFKPHFVMSGIHFISEPLKQ